MVFGLLVSAMQLGTMIHGGEVGVKFPYVNGEFLQEFVIKDSHGQWVPMLVTTTDPLVKATPRAAGPTALSVGDSGLYDRLPSFGFQHVAQDGNKLTFTSDGPHATITEVCEIPETGKDIHVTVQAHMKDEYPRINYFLATYAFAPGDPDTTWSPGLRKLDNEVIGDHFFRSPGVVAQKGSLSAAIMPDLDVLADNRPIPTILDLDCGKSAANKPLMSFGFADYKLVSHVAFAHDASMLRPVPSDLKFAFTVHLDAQTKPASAYEVVASEMWKKYGHRYFGKILPQAMPFADYAKVCYPAAFGEKMTGGWFETTIDGQVCGGVPAGWGLDIGWVSWQDWFNQLRSAWGLHWWGLKEHNQDWIDKSNKMLNLALAAPMKDGACPTTYDSKNHVWKGSLITPTPDSYYDLTNMAWKGIWLLRWLQFEDCPRRQDVFEQVYAMAELMLHQQRADGSIPTWLSPDFKEAPMLDRSAQSALPIWFLAEFEPATETLSVSQLSAKGTEIVEAVRKGAHFLASEVVDQQRYYDFETFFSCSPKTCLQKNGTLDDSAMMDPHTWQRPQNTLSMQWTAEALRAAAKLGDPDGKLMDSALKALDMMCLYQNVWPISYRQVAYTYGGFGVQNSDGEYNDARQSQFGETLCDFGAQLGRQDLFERGVAAVRASLTLINHPLHEQLGIYPDPNYPLGLEPENDGHGGSDEHDGRTGFDWGEGSGLAGIASILGKYGETYQAKNWTVTVDGVKEGGPLPQPRGGIVNPLVDPTFDFSDWRMPGWTIDGDFLHWATNSHRAKFNTQDHPFIGTAEDGNGSYDDAYTGTLTSPEFTVTKPSIKLLVGGGAGAGEYVELIDDKGKQLLVEHGRNKEEMDERTWDVSGLKGKLLRIRIVDQEKDGWGHINVGEIRSQ